LRRRLWILAAPPLLNLGFNAFFTLDIPRYNYVLMPCYATALGLVLWGAGAAAMRRHARATHPAGD